MPLLRLADHPKFRKHALAFTRLLEAAVDSLEDVEGRLGDLLHGYGEKHVVIENERGALKSEYWHAFMNAMIAYCNTWKDQRKETADAWKALVVFLVHKIYQGYVETKNKGIGCESDQGAVACSRESTREIDNTV